MVAAEKFSDFEDLIEERGGTSVDQRIKIFYKNEGNWRNVVYSSEGEIYNLTVFTEEQLDSAAYQMNAGLVSTDKREELIHEDGRYIVHSKRIDGYTFYRLYDITDVYQKVNRYTLYYVLISLGMLVIIMIVTMFVLRGVLSPLSTLTDATNDMAEGDYSKRVEVSSKDEIGTLAAHFNEMAEAVEENSRRLTESEYKKTLMMGNLSHELKTPMTAIAGYAETLLTTKLSEEQKNEALYYIYSETNRLGRLSKKMMQLLSLSEGEAVENKDIDATELLESITETMSVKAKEKGVQLITECDVEVIHTDEDRDHLKTLSR